MIGRKIISLLMVLLLSTPPAQGWGQGREEPRKMEDQARFYLQRVVPEPGAVPGQLPPQMPPPPAPAPEPAKVLTAAPRQPEETSAAEKRAEDHGMPVKQYGYSFFYKPPETFLPVQNIPVGPDYVIGPGDTVHVVVWGSIQGEYAVTVDRNGTIAIPKVGVIHVSGLTYRQLREVLDKEFARQFTNFQINVTLDNLRTIQVYVVGQARFPGTYAVSSLSTLISALFASGGPSKSGSLRHIQVRRGNRIITRFDMYDFLLRGDKSKDIRLQSEDVIFIPPIGPLAAIGFPSGEGESEEDKQQAARSLGLEPPRPRGGALEAGKMGPERKRPEVDNRPESKVGGPVKVPGIFELKNERTLTELLNLAGGLADTAFKGRVQVLRIKDGRSMILLEDDLQKVLGGRISDISLVDGDMVKVFPVPSLVEQKVRVAGAVKRPGVFGIRDKMRIKDLINYAGGLLMEASQEEAEVTRVAITPQGPETTRLYISPRRALANNPQDNILLKPNDYLFVRTVPDWDLYKVVTVTGELKFPGSYTIKKGETLSSLLARSGGFTDKAYPKGAIFTRAAVKEMQTRHLKQAIDRVEIEMYTLATQKLQAEAEPEEAKRQQAFLKQQQYLLAKLREIVPLGRVVVQLDDPERLRGTPADIELQEGDSLMVPQVQQSVNVLGAVANPTAIVFERHSTVADYLARAGGVSKNADIKSAYVLKVNGAAVGRRWGFNSLRLDPGDSIVVPEELEKINWLREIKDVATIIGQIALTAGVVLVGLK